MAEETVRLWPTTPIWDAVGIGHEKADHFGLGIGGYVDVPKGHQALAQPLQMPPDWGSPTGRKSSCLGLRKGGQSMTGPPKMASQIWTIQSQILLR